MSRRGRKLAHKGPITMVKITRSLQRRISNISRQSRTHTLFTTTPQLPKLSPHMLHPQRLLQLLLTMGHGTPRRHQLMTRTSPNPLQVIRIAQRQPVVTPRLQTPVTLHLRPQTRLMIPTNLRAVQRVFLSHDRPTLILLMIKIRRLQRIRRPLPKYRFHHHRLSPLLLLLHIDRRL